MIPESRPKNSSAWPTAKSKIFAVIGDPIEHSLSPSLLNCAFSYTGLDAVYVAFRVSEGDLEAAVLSVRALGIMGLSVTMPHKESIIPHLDRVTERSRRLNSVNCVYWDNGQLIGDSTDGEALVESIELEIGERLAGKRIMLIGTGGAARAIALALSECEPKEIVAVGRRIEAVDKVVDLGGAMARRGRVEEAPEVDVLINATSLGMEDTSGAGISPVSPRLLRKGHFVYDIIYFPMVTPLLSDAIGAGARVSNGMGMLTHQAARAFSIWTQMAAPTQILMDEAKRLTAR